MNVVELELNHDSYLEFITNYIRNHELNYVKFYGNIEYIEEGFLNNCSSLTKIEFDSPKLNYIHCNTFKNCDILGNNIKLNGKDNYSVRDLINKFSGI